MSTISIKPTPEGLKRTILMFRQEIDGAYKDITKVDRFLETDGQLEDVEDFVPDALELFKAKRKEDIAAFEAAIRECEGK